MIIQNTIPILILDTQGELYGFTIQNNDAANDVYVSSNRGGLAGSGGATPPSIGIRVAANGGSWTVMWFKGKLYGIALNAAVNLSVEVWKLGHIPAPPNPPPVGTPCP